MEALKDIPGHPPKFEDKNVIEQVMNDLSGSITDDQSLNLFEYVFLRAVADAWTLSAGNEDTITKDQLLDVGLKFMPHLSAYEGQLKNVLFEAIDFQNFSQVYDFVETMNLYHKFLIFESMRKHNSINGTLTQRSLLSAINDHVGPTRLFEVQDQDKIFNLEQAFLFTDEDESIGIDFSAFYFMMRCIAATKQYGKKKYGALEQKEFESLVKEHTFFFKLKEYIEHSFKMEGDYKKEKHVTPEMEGHLLSGGMFNPMQERFKETPHRHHRSMRLMRAE